MNITRRILIPASLAAALWFSPGCDGFKPLFDSTNLDPHPPVITALQTSPAEIFAGENIRGTLSYLDPGGDIEEMAMRDLDSGATFTSSAPFETDAEVQPLFFPGTTGSIEWQTKLDTNQAGVHRIKVWLVDSKNSRSEPAFFEVTVNF